MIHILCLLACWTNTLKHGKIQRHANRIHDTVYLNFQQLWPSALNLSQLLIGQLKNIYLASFIWRFPWIRRCFVNHDWRSWDGNSLAEENLSSWVWQFGKRGQLLKKLWRLMNAHQQNLWSSFSYWEVVFTLKPVRLKLEGSSLKIPFSGLGENPMLSLRGFCKFPKESCFFFL